MMRRLLHAASLVVTTALLGACAGHTVDTTAPATFTHDLAGPAVPWTHTEFDAHPDKFTFALFSDLTGGEREGVFEQAIEQLRMLRPELILSVGDLIEGGTTDVAKLHREWDAFDLRADMSLAPVFRVGGNHDLTNPDMWRVWELRYGKRYYHFIYKNVLFLVLDTEDNTPEFQQYIHEIRQDMQRVVDEQGWGAFGGTHYGQLEERRTGRISAQQATYFKDVIAGNQQVRWTFVVMHKPAWLRPDEDQFSGIEAALAGRPYTVFYGHRHAYLHEQRFGRDYIRLGTTGGVHTGNKPMSVDHVTLVTVSDEDPEIANLRLSGIFDRTGKIPLNGDERCLEDCFTD